MADKALLKKQQERWGDAVANGNYDELDDILTEDFVDHDPGDQTPDREGVKNFFRGMHKSFSDFKPEPVELHVSDDGYVAMRYNVSGRHTGDFMGYPATGKSFETTAMQLARFNDDGMCVERWGVTDHLPILQQLGLVSANG